MKVALVGAAGQLGTALAASRPAAVSLVPLGHADIEIREMTSVESALTKARADWVINAAAYNFVDRAEDEPELAYAVNALRTTEPRTLVRGPKCHTRAREHRLRLH